MLELIYALILIKVKIVKLTAFVIKTAQGKGARWGSSASRTVGTAWYSSGYHPDSSSWESLSKSVWVACQTRIVGKPQSPWIVLRCLHS